MYSWRLAPRPGDNSRKDAKDFPGESNNTHKTPLVSPTPYRDLVPSPTTTKNPKQHPKRQSDKTFWNKLCLQCPHNRRVYLHANLKYYESQEKNGESVV